MKKHEDSVAYIDNRGYFYLYYCIEIMFTKFDLFIMVEVDILNIFIFTGRTLRFLLLSLPLSLFPPCFR